jgi:hypothetical protein
MNCIKYASYVFNLALGFIITGYPHVSVYKQHDLLFVVLCPPIYPVEGVEIWLAVHTQDFGRHMYKSQMPYIILR